MTAEEIKEHYDQINSRCNCDPLSLTPLEIEQLQDYAAAYYQLTGKAIPPTVSPACSFQ